jgi:hypothetical protein
MSEVYTSRHTYSYVGSHRRTGLLGTAYSRLRNLLHRALPSMCLVTG